MLRNVSQADASAEAFISSSLDIRKMMLSKYPPFTLPQAAVSPLAGGPTDVERTEAARGCERVGVRRGGGRGVFERFQDDTALEGWSVCRCVFKAAAESKQAGSGNQKGSLEINAFSPSAHVHHRRWQRPSQSEFLRLTLDFQLSRLGKHNQPINSTQLLNVSCLETNFKALKTLFFRSTQPFVLFHSQAHKQELATISCWKDVQCYGTLISALIVQSKTRHIYASLQS